MDTNIMYTIPVLLLVLTVCKAQIRCYVCTTSSGLYRDKCGDEFRLTSVDSSSCQGTCQKTRGYRAEGSRTVVEITRGCVSYTSSEGCNSGDHLGISADICTCNTELCNNAQTLAPPTGISITLGCLLGMLMFWIL